MPNAAKPTTSDDVLRALRAFGLAFPGAHAKSPWPDHLDLAVNDKTFAYLSQEGEPLSLSCKLPQSSATALLLPFAEPTAYGLGSSGWVTAKFDEGVVPPLDVLQAWVDESYRAQAPKRLVTKLTAATKVAPPAKPEPAKKAAPAKPGLAKKPAAPAKKAAAAKPELAKKAAAPAKKAAPAKRAAPAKPELAKKAAAPAKKKAAPVKKKAGKKRAAK
jgi:predicted DNA-binding protein (MmcQ/YjbR family)